MFERYTEKARRVIFFARYEASQFGAPAIEPEHLLLGLMREDKTLTSRFLARAQASLEMIRKEIEGRAPLREKISTSVELPLAPETKRVLAFAHEESDRLQHRHIGTEHLLLGLLREERSMAAEILYERGLRLSAVRDEVAGVTSIEPRALQNRTLRRIFEIRAESQKLTTLADELLRDISVGEGGELSDIEDVLEHLKADAGKFDKRLIDSQKIDLKTGRQMRLGIEKLYTEKLDLLRGARAGLVCNQASVDHQFRHVADLLRSQREIKLTALFGPQHGLRGDVQDNMVETPHILDAETGLPIYSLYSETREPTERMLEDIDVLIFDMQDVGCRIYTFIYTLANCMRAAARFGKRVIVCDRPNPINGITLEGTVLELEYESFVGQYPIPTRHGMTVCELAKMFNEHWNIGCELELILMDGWSRELWFDQTDAPWVMPSPNMPTLEAATVFPGTVHLEGTQISEGRGTTRPFELIGAPYIDASDYTRRLEGLDLQGVRFRATNFLPTFQKHAGQVCGGTQIHVTDRAKFEPVHTGVAAVKLAHDLYPEHFHWKNPPYEYVHDKNPFDVIAGTASLRLAIEAGDSLETISNSWREKLEGFEKARTPYLLY